VRPAVSGSRASAFEQKIAAMIRARWPGALVRRASQAERAHNPDVFVEGGPRILQRLWMELQDSAHPTPSKKLEQARRDVERDPRSYAHGEHRLPVAITHKLGSPTIEATIRLCDLLDIVEPALIHCDEQDVVTIELDAFLGMIDRGATRQMESEAA
jgi:hypothetical protein